MITIIGTLIAFGIVAFIAVKMILEKRKNPAIAQEQKERNAINNLYPFMFAMAVLFATLIFSDSKFTSDDYTYVFQFVIITVVGLVIIQQGKKKYQK